jgi:hypothetical protein
MPELERVNGMVFLVRRESMSVADRAEGHERPTAEQISCLYRLRLSCRLDRAVDHARCWGAYSAPDRL